MTRVRHAAGIIGRNGNNNVRIFQVGGVHGAGTSILQVNSFFLEHRTGNENLKNFYE